MKLPNQSVRHKKSIVLPFQAFSQNSRIRKWLWKQIVFALLLLVIYLWLQQKREPEKSNKTEIIVSDQIPEKEATKTADRPPPATPNDLTRVKGIGPKYAAVLQRAGVLSFSQLARLDSTQITKVLEDAGVPFADPSSWPEQARLAAEDDWQGLAELQENI